jgi:dTMP kinase
MMHKAPDPGGRFIVIEGIEGCGSSTQAAILVEKLRHYQQREVLATEEPSVGPVGALLNEVLKQKMIHPGTGEPHTFGWAAMALLFAADRVDHVDTMVRPALRKGTWVVSDRYYLSSLIFQSQTNPKIGLDSVKWIRSVNALAVTPHLTIILKVSVETAAKRRLTRGGVPELYGGTELQKSLAFSYSHTEAYVPDDNVVVVDGEGDPEQVSSRVWSVVLKWWEEDQTGTEGRAGFPTPM